MPAELFLARLIGSYENGNTEYQGARVRERWPRNPYANPQITLLEHGEAKSVTPVGASLV